MSKVKKTGSTRKRDKNFVINSINDIDLNELSRHLPSNAVKLQAFINNFRLVESEMSSPHVRMTKTGPVFGINIEWVRENIFNYYELAFCAYHELLHILCGHLQTEKTFHTYGIKELGDMTLGEFFESHQRGEADKVSDEAMQNYLLSKYTDEMEIKALEQFLMPDDVYHEVNKALFSKEENEAYRIFWRGTNLEEIEERHLKIFHKAIYSGKYSKRNAYHILKYLGKDKEMHIPKIIKIIISGVGIPGKGSDGESEKGEGEDTIHIVIDPSSDSSVEDGADISDLADAVKEAISKTIEEEMKKRGEASKSEGKSETGDRESKDVSKPESREGYSTGVDTTDPTIDEFLTGLNDIVQEARRGQLTRKILSVSSIMSPQSLIASRIKGAMGGAIMRSPIPNFINDPVARKNWVLGIPQNQYLHKKDSSIGKVATYFDVSGSQDEWIPACAQALLHNRDHIGALHLFGTIVAEVSIKEFMRRAQNGSIFTENGSVMNVISNGNRGTDFLPVMKDIEKRGYDKVMVITDNQASLVPDSVWMPMKQRGLFFLMVYTGSYARMNSDANGSPWGFPPALISDRISLLPSVSDKP